MRTSEAARYARWAAGAAILLSVTVAGVFAYRSWQVRRALREVPPAVPAPVKQRSAEFSFSKAEGERTLFTIRASQSTQFKEGEKFLLQEVWITIYGRAGKRFDNIHTRSCNYEPETGRITCAGEVQIDLESAEEARARPGQRVIHIRTQGLAFDRETGEAHTEAAVTFDFPYGGGRGVGVTYSTRDATLRLHRDVEVTLTQSNRGVAGSAPSAPVVLTGGSLEYHRDDRTLRLLPPVRVKQGARELTAGNVALEFDPALRARRLLVTGNPRLHSTEPGGEVTLAADEFVALFRPEGWTERVIAQGRVSGRLESGIAEDRIEAQRLEAELEPGRNEPRLLTATGGVRILAQPARASAPTRRLETESLRLALSSAGPRGSRRITRAETLAPGTIELLEPGQTTRLRGERLSANFDRSSRIQQLAGSSGVEIERRFAGGPAQVSRSQEFEMKFGAGGEWSEVEQRGRLRFQEGERTVQAERGRMARSTDTLVLTGSATVADALTQTTAETLSINQRTGEITGEGSVRTTYRTAERNGLTNLDPQPAHLSADRLRASRDAGRALYSGRARLWQGDAVIEAASIELLRDERRLEARGGVQGLFPQAPAQASAKPNLWRFRGAALTYSSGEGKAHLEDNVTAQSGVGQISSRSMDLFFAAGADGARGLSRAVATGGVNVRQGTRRGVAERAEYVVAEEKFVLSGGTPTLFDAARGTTTGRQLTFFLADDKILIDSEEGSRTLTKHRVEK